MIRKRVVLILGAGASMPYGFPSGADLVRRIQAPEGTAQQAIFYGFTEKAISEFKSELMSAQVDSIDTFLELRREYEAIGKLFIAHKLIQSEQISNLYNIPIKLQSGEEWYRYFINSIMDCKREVDFFQQDVKIVTYNYDRSFEHFLVTALNARYKTPVDELIDKIENPIHETETFEIIKPHGTLGSLKVLRFKDKRDAELGHIELASKSIRIIYENIDQDPVFSRIHKVIKSAERLIFLGFGYNEENIRRLKLNETVNQNCRIAGTYNGFTKSELTHKILPQIPRPEGTKDLFESNFKDIGILDFLKAGHDYFL